MKHIAVVKNGQLLAHNKELLLKDIRKREGKEVTIDIKTKSGNRSNAQNRYLHGVVFTIIADHLGYDSIEEIKGIVKYALGIKKTSGLTTVEFEGMCRKIRTWASQELSLYIPEPNEIERVERVMY